MIYVIFIKYNFQGSCFMNLIRVGGFYKDFDRFEDFEGFRTFFYRFNSFDCPKQCV